MNLRWAASSFAALIAGCAASSPGCHNLDSMVEWHKLDSPPDFVVAQTYEEMFPRGVPADPDDFVWYGHSSGRLASCLPGNRHGCGEFVFYFSGGDLEDVSEIVVCGGSANNQNSVR